MFSKCRQSTGAFYAVSRYAGATPIPPSVLSRGVGWQVILLMKNDCLCSILASLTHYHMLKYEGKNS